MSFYVASSYVNVIHILSLIISIYYLEIVNIKYKNKLLYFLSNITKYIMLLIFYENLIKTIVGLSRGSAYFSFISSWYSPVVLFIMPLFFIFYSLRLSGGANIFVFVGNIGFGFNNGPVVQESNIKKEKRLFRFIAGFLYLGYILLMQFML